jgi:hypothetical protein
MLDFINAINYDIIDIKNSDFLESVNYIKNIENTNSKCMYDYKNGYYNKLGFKYYISKNNPIILNKNSSYEINNSYNFDVFDIDDENLDLFIQSMNENLVEIKMINNKRYYFFSEKLVGESYLYDSNTNYEIYVKNKYKIIFYRFNDADKNTIYIINDKKNELKMLNNFMVIQNLINDNNKMLKSILNQQEKYEKISSNILAFQNNYNYQFLFNSCCFISIYIILVIFASILFIIIIKYFCVYKKKKLSDTIEIIEIDNITENNNITEKNKREEEIKI